MALSPEGQAQADQPGMKHKAALISRSRRAHGWPEQVAHAEQVVGNHVQASHGNDVALAAQVERPKTTERLDPAKHLLDAPAGFGRWAVALVPGSVLKAQDHLHAVT
jgi:hypothetical protein